MQSVIDEIAAGDFKPDETRSGYRAVDGYVTVNPDPEVDGDDLEEQSSEDSADEEDDADDLHLVAEHCYTPWYFRSEHSQGCSCIFLLNEELQNCRILKITE